MAASRAPGSPGFTSNSDRSVAATSRAAISPGIDAAAATPIAWPAGRNRVQFGRDRRTRRWQSLP